MLAQPNGLETFTYDDLGRLTGWYELPSSIEYEYDALGNRTGWESYFGVAAILDYNYDGTTSILDSVVQVVPNPGTRQFSHDDVGNVIADGLTTYGYSNRNKMRYASGTPFWSFQYNADGFLSRTSCV